MLGGWLLSAYVCIYSFYGSVSNIVHSSNPLHLIFRFKYFCNTLIRLCSAWYFLPADQCCRSRILLWISPYWYLLWFPIIIVFKENLMVECTATKRKRARKKREAETSLYSLALYNAQHSFSTKLSLGTLSKRQWFSFGAGYGSRTRLHGLGSRCITDIRILHIQLTGAIIADPKVKFNHNLSTGQKSFSKEPCHPEQA